MSPSAETQILILGGGYAGQMAASRLSLRGVDARVTVIDASPVFVERIRLHQAAAGEELLQRSMTEMLPGDVALVTGRASALDTADQTVSVQTAEGPRTLRYDWLIYTLGSRTETSRVPGVAAHAHALNSPAEAEKIARAIPGIAASGGRLVVVGGGLTAVEVATELAEKYPSLKVEMISAGPLCEGLSPQGEAHLRASLARNRITLREHSPVREVRATEVQLDGGISPFDLCIWAGGFSAPPLAAAAGLPVNNLGQILVDPDLRVSGHANILAAGDAAAMSSQGGGALGMSCATAMPSGAFAGENLAILLKGQAPRAFRFGNFLRCMSLGRKDGLVQFLHANSEPRSLTIRNRSGAAAKEFIMRYTILNMRGEKKTHLPLYQWPQPRRWPAPPLLTAKTQG